MHLGIIAGTHIKELRKTEKYNENKIQKSQISTCTTSNNMFHIEFLDQADFGFHDAQFGADRRGIVCQVFEDVSMMIQSQNINSSCFSSVNVEVDLSINIPLSQNNVLASGSTIYGYNPNSSGILHGETWKVINSGEDQLLDFEYYHGYLRFNFHSSINWNTDLTIVSPQSPDLYATVLHEVFHMLGFASAIETSSGAGKNGYYYPWDNLIKDSQGNKIINGSCYNHTFNNNVSLTSGCSSLHVSDGSLDHVIHTPSVFENGRSLSHLDNCPSQNAYYIMHPYQITGSPIRVPSQEEVLLLCELGYETTGVYGDGSLPFHKAYDANWDCGIKVAGVSDGAPSSGSGQCVQAIDVQCDPVDVLYSQLLSNDVGNMLSISCLQMIDGTGTINVNANAFTFTPDAPGTVTLSYIPIDDLGNEGNVTEVFLSVNVCPSAGLNCVNTDPCNMICNSDFNDDLVTCNYTLNTSTCPTQGILGVQNCTNNGGFSGWFPAALTPDFIDPCIWTGGTWLPPLLDQTSGYMQMWCGPYQANTTEVIGTSVDVNAGTNYLLSFYRTAWATSPQITLPLDQLDVELVNGSDIVPNITNTEIIYTENNIYDQWERIVVCFTPSNDKEYLIFRGYDTQLYRGRLFLDNVELIEDTFSAGNDVPIDCGQQVTLGSSSCEISDTNYQWYTIETTGPVIINGETNQTLTVSPAITTTYRLVRTILGNHGNCLTSEDDVTVTVPCDPAIDINIKFFLEGAMLPTNLMSTELYNKDLLPGMTFTNGQLGTETPAGQPYNTQPWNYYGFEGATFTNTDYTNSVVDWVLVSLRTGINESTQIAMTAALLLEDGTIDLVNNLTVPNASGSYYIVIQHRNHLPVMSPTAITPINGFISYDFTTQNSWAIGGFGQKQDQNNTWMMFAGNAEQHDSGTPFQQRDINGPDKIEWSRQNGVFSRYEMADINMNGDVTGDDKIIWSNNNGIHSAIPMPN